MTHKILHIHLRFYRNVPFDMITMPKIIHLVTNKHISVWIVRGSGVFVD